MTMKVALPAFWAILSSLALSAPAPPGPILLKNACIHTVTRGVIEKGMILIRDSKIVAVGRAIEIPEAATVLDCQGQDVYPGFVDANTRIGLANDLGQDAGILYSPAFRAVDSLSPYGEIYGADDIVATGVTTVYTAPKLFTWKAVAGTGCVFKLIDKFIPLRVLSASAGMQVDLGYPEIKRMRSESLKAPRTQMGVAAAVREYFQQAKNQQGAEKPDADFGLEAMQKVLRGEIPARIECEKENEIRAALDIAKEFGLKVILERCQEAYKFADELRREKIPCVVGPVREEWGEGLKDKFAVFENAGRLAKAGVKIAIQAENFGNFLTYPRTLTIEAAWAVKYGLDPEEAIRAITINAAEILGVADRVGSIEAGKDADLVVLTGHPLDLRSRITMVVIDGEIVFSGV
jgi:imidazolonepropionase-like amidohydrolase